MQKVFIIEDDRIQRITMADEIKDAGFKVVEFSEPLIALQQLKEQQVDMIFCDLKLPQIDGIEFLKRAKKINPEVSVVIMTSYATYPEAVKAIKLGAYDFITKPIPTEEILLLLEKNKEFQKITNENINLRKQITEQNDFSTFIGSPENVKKIQNLINTVASTASTILIIGETGTGKELVAKLIHYNSNRSKYPLIKVNCAILAREIFESELFGHTKGAFTGAEKEKKGRFELAVGGSIYLDDIDDLPLELQVKLLRVIEEREIERVGSSEPIKIDVRLIASTKKDLKKLVAEGKFREDLFYRLNVIPIYLQPLRERKKDISELFNYFIKKIYNYEHKKIDFKPLVSELLYNREINYNIEVSLLLDRMKSFDLDSILEERDFFKLSRIIKNYLDEISQIGIEINNIKFLLNKHENLDSTLIHITNKNINQLEKVYNFFQKDYEKIREHFLKESDKYSFLPTSIRRLKKSS